MWLLLLTKGPRSWPRRWYLLCIGTATPVYWKRMCYREFRRAPFAARFRYGYLLANAREEYLEAVLLREFVGQVEETRVGTRTEVTLASIIRAIDPGARDNNNSSEANKGDSDLNDGNAGGRRGSYGSNDSTGSDTTLAAQLGDDDRAAETLLLALLDFSGELARLGTIETARYGWPALAVAQDLLWHTRELAPYAHDAGVRRFDAKLATLGVSVGKLERLLTLACVTTPQTTVAPLSGSAPAADPSVSSKRCQTQQCGPRVPFQWSTLAWHRVSRTTRCSRTRPLHHKLSRFLF